MFTKNLNQNLIQKRLEVHHSKPLEVLQPLSTDKFSKFPKNSRTQGLINKNDPFFNLPKTEFILWVVCGSVLDLPRFIEYYHLRLPSKTRAVVLLDNNFPDADVAKQLFSLHFDCFFIENPVELGMPFNFFQLGIFRSLWNKIGKGCWNLFVDLDEFIPLPKSHKTFKEFCGLLKSKEIYQLQSNMWDVWELMKEKEYEYYIESKPYNLSSEKVEEGMWISLFDDVTKTKTPIESFFIRENGNPYTFYTYLRSELIGYSIDSSLIPKFCLVYGKQENSNYTLAAHELFFKFSSINELTLHYPLLHFKGVRTLVSDSNTRINRYLSTKFEFGSSFDESQRSMYLENLNKKGWGNYNLFSDRPDTSVFDKFGDYLRPMKEIFSEDYTFDLDDDGVKQMFPIFNVQPLIN